MKNKKIVSPCNRKKCPYYNTLSAKCKDCAIADICGGGCKENNKEINRNYTCDIMKAIMYYMFKEWKEKKYA